MKLLSFGTFPMFPTQKKILPAPFARLDTPVSSSRDVTQPWLFGCMAAKTPRWFEHISFPKGLDQIGVGFG